jgi:hypothetical protein
MAVLRMAINIINLIDKEFRDVPKKFVMMSGIGHTSKLYWSH